MLKFNIIQIILAITLITAVLLQAKSGGLSGVFGGDGNIYLAKRGAEKTLFLLTIVNAVIFFSITLLRVVLF